MSSKVIIIGHVDHGRTTLCAEMLATANHDVELMTLEEMMQSDQVQTYKISKPPIIDEFKIFTPPPTRAERREQQRKRDKKK